MAGPRPWAGTAEAAPSITRAPCSRSTTALSPDDLRELGAPSPFPAQRRLNTSATQDRWLGVASSARALRARSHARRRPRGRGHHAEPPHHQGHSHVAQGGAGPNHVPRGARRGVHAPRRLRPLQHVAGGGGTGHLRQPAQCRGGSGETEGSVGDRVAAPRHLPLSRQPP
jgi:hypothetical protein